MATSYNSREYELGVRNLDALVANFYKADAQAQIEFRAAVQEAGHETRDLTEFLAPKDTWFMSEHVHVHFTPSGLGFDVGWNASDFIEADLAFYPVFQEFGTKHMAAQPSLGPAYEQMRPNFEKNIAQSCSRALARTFT